MTTSDALRDDTARLLQRFIMAHTANWDFPFEFRPIKGYAFAWILHPGFDDGTRMAGLPALHELEQAGILAFEDDGFPTRQTTFRIAEAAMDVGKQ
jgi:hypothetical protein